MNVIALDGALSDTLSVSTVEVSAATGEGEGGRGAVQTERACWPVQGNLLCFH